jgi:hypothetical protein
MMQRPLWQRLSPVTLSLWLLLFAAELFASIYLCGNRLIFTLDDPYIHLAVADQILSGGYGVNGSEFSSPSSSIIWPYLMAVTEALHLGPFGPLVINAAAACAAILACLRLFETTGLLDGERDRLFSYAISVLAILFTSAIALPMTGLEHSLHVLATIVTFAALVGAARGEPPAMINFVALVLLPLIRFEGAAFAFAAIGGFALLGQRRFAAAAAAVIFCALGAYSALMASRGLPLLPSSILLKSRVAETAYEHVSALDSILENLIISLISPYGQRLLLLGVAVGVGAWWLRADRKLLVVCATVLAAIGAHLLFGQYGSFYRYEVYVLALGALALLVVAAQARPLLSPAQWTGAKIGVVLLLAFAAAPYVPAALSTPFAARNTYEQQYQMSVFARQLYNRPVAVNDLGLVAYRNPNFVLDLFGLGSEKVRKAKLAGQYGPEQMATLADEHRIGLVMIYDKWFPRGVPASWKKVAVLHTSQLSAAQGDVAFYRTLTADADEVAKALDVFKSVLPPRDRLEITAPES